MTIDVPFDDGTFGLFWDLKQVPHAICTGHIHFQYTLFFPTAFHHNRSRQIHAHWTIEGGEKSCDLVGTCIRKNVLHEMTANDRFSSISKIPIHGFSWLKTSNFKRPLAPFTSSVIDGFGAVKFHGRFHTKFRNPCTFIADLNPSAQNHDVIGLHQLHFDCIRIHARTFDGDEITTNGQAHRCKNSLPCDLPEACLRCFVVEERYLIRHIQLRDFSSRRIEHSKFNVRTILRLDVECQESQHKCEAEDNPHFES